jgi:hypothetical protein
MSNHFWLTDAQMAQFHAFFPRAMACRALMNGAC